MVQYAIFRPLGGTTYSVGLSASYDGAHARIIGRIECGDAADPYSIDEDDLMAAAVDILPSDAICGIMPF